MCQWKEMRKLWGWNSQSGNVVTRQRNNGVNVVEKGIVESTSPSTRQKAAELTDNKQTDRQTDRRGSTVVESVLCLRCFYHQQCRYESYIYKRGKRTNDAMLLPWPNFYSWPNWKLLSILPRDCVALSASSTPQCVCSVSCSSFGFLLGPKFF